mmetsp:Transcript_6572/g.12355  ORF Transcript_6572/g.12355 Transcript_6572/m.12355 type:complete len:111 (+) Transcript_6572:30-362(+)
MSESKSSDPVDALLKANALVVFSATYCPYCTKVKKLLKDLGANAKIVETNVEKNGAELKKSLLAKTGRSSVPQVFVAGKFIGGCNDGPGVMPLHQSGKLVPMLKEAKAVL